LVDGEGVGDFDGEFAGITFFAFLAGVTKAESGLAFAGGGLGGPKDFVETAVAAVEVAGDAAGAVVGGNVIGLAVESESAVGDAIADAADDRSEIGGLGGIALDRVKTQNDVFEPAVSVRSE
jgi:hypothetical protein